MGRVFTWGDNISGQLGDNGGRSFNSSSLLRALPNDITSIFNLESSEKIVALSLGSDHSSALSSTGRFFTWGLNNSGQLGDNSTTKRLVPTEITSRFSLDSNDKIVSLSLGWSHSSALSSTGRVLPGGKIIQVN
jgi:alpha-tubulin suppressor-like RCC1 family protein